MSKKPLQEMLCREKLLPPTRVSKLHFLSEKEIKSKFKDINFFNGKHVTLPKS
jgi:hypothetical protein